MPRLPKTKPWTVWVFAVLGLAVFFWPLMQGERLREKAARRLLDQGWNPEYKALPMLALAYNHSQNDPKDTALLDRVWPEMRAFKGNHPEFFWLTLSVLEQRAGRSCQANEAKGKATALDPKILNMVQGPSFAGYRRAMGIRKG